MIKNILFAIMTISSSRAFAETALCKIKIEDVNKASTYDVEEKFDVVEGGAGRRKEFETPGNDYKCTLTFFDLRTGTMISCEYKKDSGKTFFQSDRSGIKERPSANKLTFRHGNAFVALTASCE